MVRKAGLLITGVSFLLFLLTAKTQDLSELDELIENTRKCHRVPALSMAIVASENFNPDALASHGQLIYAKGFGVQNWARDVPASNSTLFCIGSLTKHFTATLLLHLLRLGRNHGYNYDESSLLTEFDGSLDFDGSTLRGATVEDVLSHRTGIVETFGPFLVGYAQNLTRADLAQIAAHVPRVRQNREIYLYNNHVFSVGEILGKLLLKSHVSWEFLLREYLLRPMGISHDVEFADSADVTRLATPYFSVNGALREADRRVLQLIQPAGPSGSICISAQAMVRWMQFLLGQGRFQGKDIVAAEDIRNTCRQRIAHPAQLNGGGRKSHEIEEMFQAVRSGYALGWTTGFYRGYSYVGHGGGFYPFVSLITVFPQLNISLYSSTSGPATKSLNLRSLHLMIVDRLLGLRSARHRCANKPEEPRYSVAAGGSMVNLDPKTYQGVYEHPVFGRANIVIDNKGQLRLLIGRFGNATIHCETSDIACELKFEGILWWISESDAFRNDKETNRTIIFGKTKEHVRRIILPLFSNDLPVEFYWLGQDNERSCRKVHGIAVTCSNGPHIWAHFFLLASAFLALISY